jgi:SAM-dependent methyltransferase
MNWRVKGVIQGALSRMPAGGILNNYLQTALGGLRDFEANVDAKVLDDWLVLVAYMQELGARPQNLDYVEVGTGWYPALPICYKLAGARSCRTLDVTRHLNHRMTFRMLSRLENHLPAIAEASFRPLAEVQTNYSSLCKAKTVEELLRAANIQYLAPRDAANTGLPDSSVDVVFSNSVLEHVPPVAIVRIMHESRRILRKGGLAIHSVNCGDHYAYFDRSITAANYLIYPERKWSKWNNRLLYQNRLRPSDFIDMAEESGMRIVLHKSKPNPHLLSILPALAIAPEFRHYPSEQLASTSVGFVAQA